MALISVFFPSRSSDVLTQLKNNKFIYATFVKKRFLKAFLTLPVVIALSVLFWKWKGDIRIHIVQKLGQNENQDSQNKLVWYEFPELGLKFRTTKIISENLKYVYQEGYDREIAAVYKTIYFKCGALTVYNKADINFKNPFLEGRPYKELGNKYIIYWAPQEPCTKSDIKIDIVNVLNRLEIMN